MDSNRASTAAVSGASRSSGPAGMPTGFWVIGAARMAAIPDRPAASIQTTRLRRRTGMPSRSDRSVESAAPRTPSPVSVREKNHHRAAARSGTASRATMSSVSNAVGSRRNWWCSGNVKVEVSASEWSTM